MTVGNQAIVKHLDGLRQQFPECSVVAFVDLSTGMVLAASLRAKMTQERLDALCLSATEAFAGAQPMALSTALGTPVAQAVACVDGQTRCFLRAANAPDEALCLVTAPGPGTDALLEAAEAVVSCVAGEG